MRPLPGHLLTLALTLCACATTQVSAPVTAPPPTAGHSIPAPAEGTAAPSAEAPAAAGFEVTAPPPDPMAFTVTGRSDLPAGPPSAAVPFARAAETAVAPLRPALTECLHPLGLRGRQGLRVIVDASGAIAPATPQRFPVTPRVAACVEGVLRAATVQPAPPRPLPLDVTLDL